jgi:hypothetical protein
LAFFLKVRQVRHFTLKSVALFFSLVFIAFFYYWGYLNQKSFAFTAFFNLILFFGVFFGFLGKKVRHFFEKLKKVKIKLKIFLKNYSFYSKNYTFELKKCRIFDKSVALFFESVALFSLVFIVFLRKNENYDTFFLKKKKFVCVLFFTFQEFLLRGEKVSHLSHFF